MYLYQASNFDLFRQLHQMDLKKPPDFCDQIARSSLLKRELYTVPIGYSDLGYSGRAAYSDLIPNGTRTYVIT